MLDHLCCASREPKRLGLDSRRGHYRADCSERCHHGSFDAVGATVCDHRPPRGVRDLDHLRARHRRSCHLEIMVMIVFVATLVLIAASALTVLVAWIVDLVERRI